ncbi:hypothetical protein D3C76_1553000 [compost metagenome]
MTHYFVKERSYLGLIFGQDLAYFRIWRDFTMIHPDNACFFLGNISGAWIDGQLHITERFAVFRCLYNQRAVVTDGSVHNHMIMRSKNHVYVGIDSTNIVGCFARNSTIFSLFSRAVSEYDNRMNSLLV